MYNLTFEKTGKKIDMQDIINLEKMVKSNLPIDFIQFYMENNGGIPEEYIYWNCDTVYVINHFLPISDEIYEGMSLNQIYEEMCIKENIISKEYIPFAMEEGGGYFLVRLSNRNESSIYYWDPENQDVNDMNQLCLISDNLEKFCAFLTDKHPD